MEHVRLNILKSFNVNIEKGGRKTGSYADTFENRKLGRVGQKYSKDAIEKENTYFKSYGQAIDYAYDQASKKFLIDDDEWFNQMASGGKPGSDKTKKGLITLYDKETGKEVKRALSIQVYNTGGQYKPFELNWYIS